MVVVVTISTFVIFFNPAEPGGGRGRGVGAQLGQIDGHQITVREFQDALRETRLLYFLNFRKFPEEDDQAHQRGFDIEREATLRLVRLAKVKEARIQVADVTVGEMAKRLLGGDPARITEFENQVLKPANLTAADFERFVRNDAAIQQLSAVYGAAGRMVTPAEAEEVYRREHQAVATQLTMFNVSNYLSRVALTNEALTQWYSNQMSRYFTPEQVNVSYVSFPRTNFMTEADKQLESITNLTALVQESYYKAGTNAFKDTNGNVLPAEKAMAKIKDEERDRRAMLFARKKANDFAGLLYDVVNSAKQPNAALLDQVAKTNNLTVHVSTPFDGENGPTNMNVGRNFAQAAFSLNATNNPILPQAIEGEDAYYVLALKDAMPSRPQSFAEVKGKVEDDYRHALAFGIMRSEAMDFQARLTNGLIAGKTFDDIATASKVHVLNLPPISRATESLTNLDDVVNVRQLKNFVLSMEPGKVSPLVPNPPEGAFIIYVKHRVPVDEAKLKEELPKFTAEMRYMRQNDLFNQWFRKVVEKAAPNLPLLNKPQQQPRTDRG